MGLDRRGRRRMMRLNDRAKGGVGKERIEEEDGRAAGRARSFIQLESGGWSVHAPCPKQGPLNPRGKHHD